MSGLQELAAIAGVSEVAFRAISSLYDFFKDLQDVPLEIERLKAETSTLYRTLRYLGSLDTAHIELQDISQRTGLAQAVNRCGIACDRLLRDLARWTPNSKHTTISKIQFLLHRKSIDNVHVEINSAKQTTILALGVAQICLQLGKPVTESEKILRITQGHTEIQMSSTSLKRNSNIGRRRRSASSLVSGEESEGREVVVYKPEERKSPRHANQEYAKEEQSKESIAAQALKVAASALDAAKANISLKKSSTGEGDNNFIGADEDAVSSLAKLEIDDCHTVKGNDNFIGVGKSGRRPPADKKGRSKPLRRA